MAVIDTTETTMRDFQEMLHGEGHKYRAPHLRHPELVELLTGVLRQCIRGLDANGLPLTVLDIGAGHGGYTVHALGAGCDVTATEMSKPSLRVLEDNFGTNPAFRGLLDADGTLAELNGEKFSLVMCCSVLHHIPDYIEFITGPVLDHLAPGGTFLSIQDPLWYPTVGALNRRADRAAYLTWRLFQGNYTQGLGSLKRRWTGHYDENAPADMVEYHVVRQGVDQDAIAGALGTRFDHVSIGKYWSTQSHALQKLGESCNLQTNFFLRAEDFRC
jgi:SAM-dependent methyltransferase